MDKVREAEKLRNLTGMELSISSNFDNSKYFLEVYKTGVKDKENKYIELQDYFNEDLEDELSYACVKREDLEENDDEFIFELVTPPRI